MALLGLSTSLVMIGVEVDASRLYMSREKTQIISDAATRAAAKYLPYQTTAQSAANAVITLYNQQGTTYSSTISFTSSVTGGVPTSVQVNVTQSLPSILPAFSFGGGGGTTMQTSATPAASRQIPSSLLQGACPLGIQYDSTYDIAASGTASSTQMTLKEGSGSTKGNYGCLRFSGETGNGTKTYQTFLKYGYDSTLSVGDSPDSKPGSQKNSTDNAISSDSDSRLNRATVSPYTNDTYTSFHSGNPRIMVLPLVDWTGINGNKPVPIKGFGAFWIDSESNGSITGRFIRLVLTSTWSGVSIDTTTSGSLDGGLWSVNFTQ